MRLIKRHSIYPRKSMGQHFLINEGFLDRIVQLCGFRKDDTVVEIGPGLGGLTSRLADQVRMVFAVEKDWKLANLLRTQIIKQKKVKVVHQDAFHFDYQWAASTTGRPLKVVGNLPFNIASRLTIELLRKGNLIECMVFMYQKEVAKRITALPGNKDYGYLTVVTNLYADVESILSVGREAFYPRPKVESTIIRFNLLRQPREKLANEQYFTMVVKAAFSQRRKKLRNALKSFKGADLSPGFIEAICRETGVDPNQRGETLDLQEFALLTNHLFFVLTNGNN